jgi:hypothetical protein
MSRKTTRQRSRWVPVRSYQTGSNPFEGYFLLPGDPLGMPLECEKGAVLDYSDFFRFPITIHINRTKAAAETINSHHGWSASGNRKSRATSSQNRHPVGQLSIPAPLT